MDDNGPTTRGLYIMAGFVAAILVAIALAYAISDYIADASQETELVAYTVPLFPACEEDEIIAGIGDYDGGGYWTEYQCSHSDTHTCIAMYSFLEQTYGPGILNPAQLGMIDLFYDSLGCVTP